MSQTQSQIPPPYLQFFDNNGVPLNGGTVETFDVDGVTPKASYQDPDGTILNTNPIDLDSAGRCLLWGTGKYQLKVSDSLGNVIYFYLSYSPIEQLGVSAAMLPVIQAATTADALALLGGTSIVSVIPAGTIVAWAVPSTVSPAGWLLCNGGEVSRTSYANLFAAIGITYGAGDGSSTFTLPDLRGRIPIGDDSMGGGNADRLTAASMGATVVVGLGGGNELPQVHNHTASDSGHSHTLPSSVLGGSSGTPAATTSFNGLAVTVYSNPTTNTGYAAITVDDTFTGNSQNIPPVLVMNYLICTG